MLFFRADANSRIGLGHVMRCLAIANAARDRGIESTFIIADEEAKEIIGNYKYSAICLNSLWDNLESEIDKLTLLINELQVEQLIVDSYFVTKIYLSKLKKLIKIIYIDDLNTFIYPVDVIINYNIYAKNCNYNDKYSNTKLFLGCDYVPLRKEFQNQEYFVREQVSNILVTTGGTDYYNMSVNILNLMLKKNQYANINFHVIIGNFNVHIDELRDIQSKNSNVKLYKNIKNISKLMKACDVAIAAGGTTLYELSACGVPSISFSLADNQLDGVNEFDIQNIIYYAGDIRESLDKCINNIDEKIQQLILNRKLRKELSIGMRKMVDGNGADRIIEELL